jgi:hypothetical protein
VPDQAATATILAGSSITAAAKAAFVAASTILATATCTGTAKAQYAVHTAISTTATCTSTGVANRGGHSTITASSTLTAGDIDHESAVASIHGSSAFNILAPTVTHNFRPVKIPSSGLPVVRANPQPYARSTTTIQPPKPPVSGGGTVKVNVKR